VFGKVILIGEFSKTVVFCIICRCPIRNGIMSQCLQSTLTRSAWVIYVLLLTYKEPLQLCH